MYQRIPRRSGVRLVREKDHIAVISSLEEAIKEIGKISRRERNICIKIEEFRFYGQFKLIGSYAYFCACNKRAAYTNTVNVKSVGLAVSRLFVTPPPSSGFVITRACSFSFLSLKQCADIYIYTHTYARIYECWRSRARVVSCPDACRYTSDRKCNETSCIHVVSRPVTVQ